MKLTAFTIIMVVMLMGICSLPIIEAATNSYTMTRTTTADLSNGAWSSGVSISSDQITHNSGTVGRYISDEYYIPSTTSGGITYAKSTDQNRLDYAWYNADTKTWLNSTDFRHQFTGDYTYAYRYPFNDNTDAWLGGSSGAQDITFYNGAAITGTGPVARVYFDGTNDYAQLDMPFDYETPWSMAGMFYVSGTTGTLIGVSNTTSNANWQLKFVDSATDYLQMYIYDSAGNTATYSSPSSFSKNNWHYIYIYCNGTNFYVYVDGVAHIASSWNIGAGNMKLRYVTMSGIRFGTTVYEPIQYTCDELRFHPGTVSSHSTLASTGAGMGQYMFEEVTDTASAPGTSYKFSTSGNVYQEIYSYRTSGYNYVYDISATFTNTAPVIVSTYPPDEYIYDTDPSVTLAVNVTDADITYSQLITAHFYVDGESKGTAYRTSNGEITKNIGTFTGGTHEWYALVYDPWSGSVLTSTGEFSVLSTLYIRDELTGELIDDVTVNLDFYTENTSTKKASSNGRVDLTGLQITNLLVAASANGYYDRKTIITSLYDTQNLYLINETESVIYNTFKLNTQSITYPVTQYWIDIQKPMNGTVDTVFSSYFGFDGSCGTYLIRSDVYRLVIHAPDGSEYAYGWLYPDPDGTMEITISSSGGTDMVVNWLTTTFTVDDDADIITYYYQSSKDIDTATFTISEGGAVIQSYNVSTNSNTFAYYSDTSKHTYQMTVTIIADDGDKYEIVKIITLNGEKINPFPASYPEWFKQAIVSIVAILFILGFSSFRVDVGCLGAAGIFCAAYLFDWFPLSLTALFALILVAMAAAIKFKRKQDRTW